MRKRILAFIAGCFLYSGLVSLARWRARRSGQQLVVLNYHRASGGNLRRHLLYLRRHYRILHIEAALEELYTPRKDARQRSDRRTPLVLTFDDGYNDNYTYAFPLARQLQVPFSIYLVPGYIESGDYFWWGEGERLVQRAEVKQAQIEGRTYNLGSEEDRQALSALIDRRVRYVHSVAEREAFLSTVRDTLAVPSAVLDEEKPAMPVNWDEVHEMEESGWVSFGAHTMHHPILAYLSDPDEVRREIKECAVALEERLGHPVRSFAYPVGQMQHIGDDVRKAAEDAGFSWALTTSYGVNTPKSDPLLLHRVEADVDQDWRVVAAEAAGLWGFFSRLRWLPFVRKYLTNSSGSEYGDVEF